MMMMQAVCQELGSAPEPYAVGNRVYGLPLPFLHWAVTYKEVLASPKVGIPVFIVHVKIHLLLFLTQSVL